MTCTPKGKKLKVKKKKVKVAITCRVSIAGARVTIARHGRTFARGTGRLKVRLARGTYRVTVIADGRRTRSRMVVR